MSTKYRKIAGRWAGWFCVVLLAVFTAVSAPGARAQSNDGSIVGTVTDTTGAIIPHATVTVTNVDNGLKLNGTSNTSGEFQIFAVPPGNYKADVAAQGFQGQTVSFAVQVATAQTLQFKLTAGAVNQTVEVTSAAPMVNTSNATMGEVIQGAQVEDLPLNGRNFTALALLAPGVTRGAYGDAASGVNGNSETFRNSESGGASISVNGLRPQADNFILDGLDDNDGLINTILIFPNIDATQEFKVDTNIAPAEYGRAGGAIVATRSGAAPTSITDRRFGSIAAEVRRELQLPVSTAREKLRPTGFLRQQPGFSIGGPVLPKLKNKLFIFGDYQAYREVEPINPYFVTVPTARMRLGDFSELLPTSPNFDALNGPSVDSQFTEPRCLIRQNANDPALCVSQRMEQLYNPMTCAPIRGQ